MSEAQGNLTPQIEAYLKVRKGYHQLEEILFGQIRVVFNREIPFLNSKLPEGYEITDYRVRAPRPGFNEKPNVSMGVPPKALRGGIHEEFDEIKRLNELLAPEYKRIQEEYGFEVNGFIREVTID